MSSPALNDSTPETERGFQKWRPWFSVAAIAAVASVAAWQLAVSAERLVMAALAMVAAAGWLKNCWPPPLPHRRFTACISEATRPPRVWRGSENCRI